MVARYRGGGGIEMQTGESSMGSLLDDDDEDTDDDDDDDDEDDEDDDDNDEEVSARRICLSSYDTKENVIIAGDTETLPCGATASDAPQISKEPNSGDNLSSQAFQWTLSNWGSTQAHRRNNSGTVRVDLASPEDISLDTDNSSRVVFSAYGTTV